MIQFSRVWAMPSADTFDVPPIAGFVQKYLLKSKVSVDPFARNKRWATYTNDLNPMTAAKEHLDAKEFLKSIADRGVIADLVIFDPPYSPGQIKEMYAGIGLDRLYKAGEESWTSERNSINEFLAAGGVVLTFGWNTVGMGKGRGFEIEEIMLCSHGTSHNDTICMAERRITPEPEFDLT